MPESDDGIQPLRACVSVGRDSQTISLLESLSRTTLQPDSESNHEAMVV